MRKRYYYQIYEFTLAKLSNSISGAIELLQECKLSQQPQSSVVVDPSLVW